MNSTSAVRARRNPQGAIASLVFVTLASGSVAAQDTQGVNPDYALTGNTALVSEYMFRGLTQTWGAPAIQGGADLTMTNGFAAGVWASIISEKTYPGAALELDLYASYGASINEDWSWRAGFYGYVYPRGNLHHAGLPTRSFNTLEANAAITWKWLTFKYSHSLTDYFGVDSEQGYAGDSHGASYVQLDAAIPFNDQWSLALHAAHTHVGTHFATPLADGAVNPDYNDAGATLKVQFASHWSASLGATYASNRAFYANTASFTDAFAIRDVGGTRGYLMLQATF